jgi:hypothetical protein
LVSTRVNLGTEETPIWVRGYKPADVVMAEPKARLVAMAEFVDRLAGDVAYAVNEFAELEFLQGAVDEAKAVVQRLQEEA